MTILELIAPLILTYPLLFRHETCQLEKSSRWSRSWKTRAWSTGRPRSWHRSGATPTWSILKSISTLRSPPIFRENKLLQHRRPRQILLHNKVNGWILSPTSCRKPYPDTTCSRGASRTSSRRRKDWSSSRAWRTSFSRALFTSSKEAAPTEISNLTTS